MKKIEPHEIDAADQAAADLKSKYLHQEGWVWSCQHPGALWLWVKSVDGKEYRCNCETAFTIQKSVYEDSLPHCDECDLRTSDLTENKFNQRMLCPGCFKFRFGSYPS